MNKTVITNLRINKHDWLQLKSVAVAAELGMSANEYINYLIRDLSAKRELLPDMKANQEISKKAAPIWELGNMAKRIKPTPMGQLSADDTVIYE